MSWVWHKPPRKVAKPQWDKAPADPLAKQLEYVYAWERRCRGYDLFPQPVALEPTWIPFLSENPQAFDPQQLSLSALAGGSLAPNQFATIHLSLEQKVTPQTAGAWLQSLPSFPASFEITGTASEILYQVGISGNGSNISYNGSGPDALGSALAMHFPLAQAEREDDVLRCALAPLRGQPVGYHVVDFGLLHFAYQPLQRWSRFALDPLSSLVNVLGQLSGDEVAGLQVLFSPVRQGWSSALQQVAQTFSDPAASTSRYAANPNDPQVQASAKTDSPLFAVVLRVFAVSPGGKALSGSGFGGNTLGGNAFRNNDQIAFDLCRRLGQCLSPLAIDNGNAFLALDNEGYGDEEHFRDLLARQTRRHGSLLSLDELVGLVHPPCETLQHPKLVRPVAGEESLPEHLLEAQGALLGLHSYRRQQQRLVWPDEFRNRHAYLLGATRMGKSTLLLNLIKQDLEAGRGLCLIDPHGDLAKDVLALVPPERAKETLYLDFADREHPPAIGLLQANDEWEARLVCSDLLSILRRLFAASWGDRLEHILRHVLLTLLSDKSSDKAHTLRDIRPLLSDKTYRERVLDAVTDPDLLAFWRTEFPGYSASTFSPIYNKLGLLLSSPIVRNIVAQSQSKLSLSSVMSHHRVLLVNLNQSLIGEDNAHFLGAMLVSKLQIAAMHSLRHERGGRTPFTLLVDEFQNFVVSSFEKILSEAGKAGLSLVMANQFLEQLPQGLQSAILGNVGTLVSFRVSSDSGRLLEKELAGKFTQSDMVSLNRGEVVARIGQAQDSFFIHTMPPPTMTPTSIRSGESSASQIMGRTWSECCRPREEVEVELIATAQVPEDGQKQGEKHEDDDAEQPSLATKKPSAKKEPKVVHDTVQGDGNRRKPAVSESEVECSAEVNHEFVAQLATSENIEDAAANNETRTDLEPQCFGVPDGDPISTDPSPSDPTPTTHVPEENNRDV